MGGKIIRFFPNKPEKAMDILTIDDLKQAGFVPYRFKDYTLSKQGQICEDHKRLVHSSVPVAESSSATESEDFEHPIIRYEFGYGYEGKFGAVRFPLRNETDLKALIRVFDYPI